MKTPRILLKLLHKSAAKPSPNFHKTASRKGDEGFSLLEVVATVLVLGILSAVAAPGWLGFINRQRVRTVNDRVFQTLRTAQSEAKRTKSDVTIVFNTDKSNPPVDPPTVTINGNPQSLNAGEIKAEQVKLSVANCPKGVCTAATSLTFNYNGAFDPDQTPKQTPFVVTVSSTGDGTKQCAIVETLLGGMRTAEGKYNATTKEGCPQ